MNDIESLIRAANPAPHTKADLDQTTTDEILQAVLTSIGAPRNPDRQSRTNVRWYLTIAAALIILALLGLRSLDSSPTTVVAADKPEIRLAREYVQARNAYDAAAAFAILHEDAEIAEYPVLQQRDDLDHAFDYLDIVDEAITIVACVSVPTEPGTTICLYEMTNLLLVATNAEPIEGTFTFVVTDEAISSISNEIDFDTYDQDAIRPWIGWLSQQRWGEFELTWWQFHLGESVPSPRLNQLPAIADAIEAYTNSPRP